MVTKCALSIQAILNALEFFDSDIRSMRWSWRWEQKCLIRVVEYIWTWWIKLLLTQSRWNFEAIIIYFTNRCGVRQTLFAKQCIQLSVSSIRARIILLYLISIVLAGNGLSFINAMLKSDVTHTTVVCDWWWGPRLVWYKLLVEGRYWERKRKEARWEGRQLEG